MIPAHSLQVGSPAWRSRMLRKSLVVQESDRGRDMCDFSGRTSHNTKQPKDTELVERDKKKRRNVTVLPMAPAPHLIRAWEVQEGTEYAGQHQAAPCKCKACQRGRQPGLSPLICCGQVKHGVVLGRAKYPTTA